MTYKFTTITQNKSLSTHGRMCGVWAVLMRLALANQHSTMILTAGQNPKGLRAEVLRPPGVRMVRPHVPLCCENNPIIAAQHQIDVKLIHSSCELTGRPVWLHAAATYVTHFSPKTRPQCFWQVRGRMHGAHLLCLLYWLTDQGLKKTPLSET